MNHAHPAFFVDDGAIARAPLVAKVAFQLKQDLKGHLGGHLAEFAEDHFFLAGVGFEQLLQAAGQQAWPFRQSIQELQGGTGLERHFNGGVEASNGAVAKSLKCGGGARKLLGLGSRVQATADGQPQTAVAAEIFLQIGGSLKGTQDKPALSPGQPGIAGFLRQGDVTAGQGRKQPQIVGGGIAQPRHRGVVLALPVVLAEIGPGFAEDHLSGVDLFG